MSDRQQLAEAIHEAIVHPDEPHGMEEDVFWESVMDAATKAALPFLVAAERAGYERCKRDATKGIEAARNRTRSVGDYSAHSAKDAFRDALAVVAALNATQQEAEPWDADECRCVSGMHTCGKPNTATQQEASDGYKQPAVCPHGCRRPIECLRYDQGGSIPADCILEQQRVSPGHEEAT